jgi:glycosyltransferase involved in cell wall biosynthesis
LTNKKTLLLFTDSYPFKGQSFVANEIDYLSQLYSKIYVAPTYSENGEFEPLIKMPQNCILVDFWALKKKPAKFSENLVRKGMTLQIFFTEVLSDLLNITWYLKNYKAFKKHIIKSIYNASIIDNWIEDNIHEEYVLYTYWFHEAADACSIIQKFNRKSNWISRIHGYELYDYRHPLNKQPLRNFKVFNCNQLYANSKFSQSYIQKKVPFNSRTKINLSYLGIDFDLFTPIVKIEKDQFVIASCSNIISLKRIHLIIEVLSKLTFNIKWVHIGDGPLYAEINKLASTLPLNIEVKFYKQVSNYEIPTVYQSENIDLFVHFSETEGGVPVCIMEALSCGIPVLATKVGGVPECINDTNGKILSKRFIIGHAVNFIDDLKHQKINFDSQKIRRETKIKFNSKNNYKKFISNISHY